MGKEIYKKDFQSWKAKREATGMVFYNRLSEVIDTDRDLSVGDMVMFTNDYGVVFGPHEIQGFCKPDSPLCPHRYPDDEHCGIVFLNNSSYWFPNSPDQLTLVTEGGVAEWKR